MADDAQSQVLRELVTEVEGALGGGNPVAVATVMDAGASNLRVGDKMLVRRDAVSSTIGTLDDGGIADRAVIEATHVAFETFPRVQLQVVYVGDEHDAVMRRSQARPGDARITLEIFESPARLIITGGGHVGLAIATIGQILGFGITVVDDRPEFANPERFPMADQILCGDFGETLDSLNIDSTCSIVLVSRGHQQDTIALRHTVLRNPGYLGMIGSRRRTGTVMQMLRDEGIPAEALDKVHTPVGLDIGAETPEEIALAILAEIVLVRKGGSGRKMSSLQNRRQAERLA